MTRIQNTWADLNDLKSDAQVIGYWDERHSRILECLAAIDSDFEIATKVMHRLAKALNNQEKYSFVFYLFKAGYQPIKDKLPVSDELNELKYELGRGLHHNRKYAQAKTLFNELASSGFDQSRLEGWWDQSAFASIREKHWISVDVLPAVGKMLLSAAYVSTAIYAKEFFLSTTVFILTLLLYNAWLYQYRFNRYLEEFKGHPKVNGIKQNIKRKVMLDLFVSLLFCAAYALKQEWLIPLVLILSALLQAFDYGLEYFYLPKLIGELNREAAEANQGA